MNQISQLLNVAQQKRVFLEDIKIHPLHFGESLEARDEMESDFQCSIDEALKYINLQYSRLEVTHASFKSSLEVVRHS